MAPKKTKAQIAAERRAARKLKLERQARSFGMVGKVAAQYVANGLSRLPK